MPVNEKRATHCSLVRRQGLSSVNWQMTGEIVQSTVCVLTAGAAGEAAVVVQVTHCLTGLVGSIDFLVALNTYSWNKKKRQNAFKKIKEGH